MRTWDAYGPPVLQIDAFRIWVHEYQYADSTDAWDGNWLRVTAHCAVSGASVVVAGALLDTVSFLRFKNELTTLYQRLQGVATLESHEPELKVELKAGGPAGHMAVRVEITPDHLNQAHHFLLDIDQTYVPEIIRGCERVLDQCPVRDAAGRGA
jgi:hypothetical protein